MYEERLRPWDDSEPYFDWPVKRPLPTPACARVAHLAEDLGITSPAAKGVRALKALCEKAFGSADVGSDDGRAPLTHEWMYGEKSPFLESHFRLPLEYVPSFTRDCELELNPFGIYDAEAAAMLRPTKCVNLAVVARGLHELLEAYNPHWRGVPKPERERMQAYVAQLRVDADALATQLERLV